MNNKNRERFKGSFVRQTRAREQRSTVITAIQLELAATGAAPAAPNLSKRRKLS